MVYDFSSVKTYQLGSVSEFCPWVMRLKACTTITLFAVILEFRKQLIYRDLLVSAGIKGMGYYHPAQIFYLRSKSSQILEI